MLIFLYQIRSISKIIGFTAVLIWFLGSVIIFACAELGEETSWENPFDPQGSNYFPPELTIIPDTIVKYSDTLTVNLEAFDKNDGEIVEYYWSFSGPVFMDSSPVPQQINLTNPGGGFVDFYYGAKDNHGLVVIKKSTFLFNRPIAYCSVEQPEKNKTASWISPNNKRGEGRVEFRFKAKDPDSPKDTLIYELLIGTHKDSLITYYKGPSFRYTMQDSLILIPNSAYHFKLLVRSAAHDTCSDTGTFFTDDSIRVK